MHILIVNNTQIPAKDYGGTERVIWWLGKELVRLGHTVTYLVAPGSSCPFARVLSYDAARPLNDQIPSGVDFIHCHFQPDAPFKKPYLITHHGNDSIVRTYDINTVFVSRNHAARHEAIAFVHNGLDPDDYGPIDLNHQRRHLLFMAYAKRPEKNLNGSKHVARLSGWPLAVVGGRRTLTNSLFSVKYHGFIGGDAKNKILQDSKAFLFPVRWHEPFGLAIIEALHFGCPVFGTTYGALPELIPDSVGFLSNSAQELASAIRHRLETFRPGICHTHVREQFTSAVMTRNYLNLYERVLAGQTLNPHPPRTADPFHRGQLLPFTK